MNLPSLCKAESESEALKKAAEAAYIQTGVKDHAEAYYKDFERKYIPTFVIKNGGVLMFLVQTITKEEARINFKWEF